MYVFCGCTFDNANTVMCSDNKHAGYKVSPSELVSTPAVNFVILNNLFRAMYCHVLEVHDV